MKYRRIFDISRPLEQGAVVYPGNPPIYIKKLRSKTSWLSEISFGSHTGTHVDAPRHAFRAGAPLESFPLKAFVGPCRVLDMTRVRGGIAVRDLERARMKKGERILFKTKNSSRGYKKFYDDYVYLESEAAEYMARRALHLVGIDSLSIKKRGRADNRAHTALLKKGIVILEGLDLSAVKPGKYFFICLPLRFVGIDGSPARAILLQ